MNAKQIVQQFARNGYQLRPDSLKLVQENLVQSSLESQRNFLRLLLLHIGKILLDKPSISSCILEKDLLSEAILFLNYESSKDIQIQDDKIKQEQIAFSNCLIVKDTFKDFQLLTQNFQQNFIQKKFEFFQNLIKNSSNFFYKQNKDKNLVQNATELMHIAQVKGRQGFYSIIGVIYQEKGRYFMEDSISKIKLNLDECEACDFYCTSGNILLAQGYNKSTMFYVKQIKCLDLSYQNKGDSLKFYKQLFYDNITKEKQLQNCYQKFFNLENERIEKQNEFVSVFSNFVLNYKNLELLEKFFCLKQQSLPVVIILMGCFFDFYPLNNNKDLQKAKYLSKQLRDLLKKYKELLQSTKIFILPDVNDEGTNTFPRQEFPESIIRYVTENNNVYLAQNPFNFCYKQKIFNVVRCDMITLQLHNSILKQQEDLDPYQLMSQTILGQRELVPVNTEDIQKIQSLINDLIVKELPNYLIIGENFIPSNVHQVNKDCCIVYASNFDITSQYLEIDLNKEQVKFETLEQINLVKTLLQKQ